jgi:hypothetical protein
LPTPAAREEGSSGHVSRSAARLCQPVLQTRQQISIRSKAAAKIGDLNVGDRVVIHAKEPSEGKLVADTVEFGAATSAQADHVHSQSTATQPSNK